MNSFHPQLTRGSVEQSSDGCGGAVVHNFTTGGWRENLLQGGGKRGWGLALKGNGRSLLLRL